MDFAHNYNIKKNNNPKEESIVFNKIINNKILFIVVLNILGLKIENINKLKYLEFSIDERMKNLNKTQKELDYKNLIQNQQIESIYLIFIILKIALLFINC